MSEAVEAATGVGWRLLATLEGGSLLLATSALLAYTARNRIARRQKRQRTVHSVLITNTTNAIGKELKQRLELRGCTVRTADSVTSGVTSAAYAGAGSGAESGSVDALVVIGAECRGDRLESINSLITEDVYDNLKLLETLSPQVRRGGCVAWACEGGPTGIYSVTSAAFDAVLRASLQHVAKISHCEPLWVGRCENAERAVELLMSELLPSATIQDHLSNSVRNAVHKVSEFIGRWLKIVT